MGRTGTVDETRGSGGENRMAGEGCGLGVARCEAATREPAAAGCRCGGAFHSRRQILFSSGDFVFGASWDVQTNSHFDVGDSSDLAYEHAVSKLGSQIQEFQIHKRTVTTASRISDTSTFEWVDKFPISKKVTKVNNPFGLAANSETMKIHAEHPDLHHPTENYSENLLTDRNLGFLSRGSASFFTCFVADNEQNHFISHNNYFPSSTRRVSVASLQLTFSKKDSDILPVQYHEVCFHGAFCRPRPSMAKMIVAGGN
ncbi:hypothetical protein R3P38DRAFT_2810903 [Favolaschia claudopus]|uniref:Uncharacterized protein n=1 Tax=Favolaschia claudopus TaxID=2862362 RepID=A0AAV9Z9Z3_9AGAR